MMADDTTYDTVFQTTQGDTLILRVNVPYSSSMTLCPAMTLAGVRVTHNWVDHRMRIIGYAPINSESAWRSSSLTLGEAVHAVVKNLQLHPPTVLEITDKGLQAIQSKQQQQQQQTQINASQQSQTNGRRRTAISSSRSAEAPPEYSTLQEAEAPIPDVNMPEIPTQFPEVMDWSREELEVLLEDELDFLSLVNRLPVMESIQKISSSVLEENVKLAKSNLEKEEQLKESCRHVNELREQLKTKVEHFQSLETQQNGLIAPPNVRDILRKLHKAKKQSLDQSEELAEEWANTGGDVDDFVQSFIQIRSIHHQRAAKMELLQRPKHL
jgi:ESCRT-I complex subunit VPS37